MPLPLLIGIGALGGVIVVGSALPKPRPTPSPWPDAANDSSYGDKKPIPPKLPDPKLPPPVLGTFVIIATANALLNRYYDKSKQDEECKETLKKYRVHRYKDRTAFTDKAAQEASHHALQNAHLEFPRGAGGLQDICPGYKEGDGVSIPLDDKPNGAHKKVGAMQKKVAQNHRDNGTRPSYKDARQATKDQMKDGVGMSDAEAECIAKFIDETMKNICPDLVDKNLPMRTW